MEGQVRDRGWRPWPLSSPWPEEVVVVGGWRPGPDQPRTGGEGRDVGWHPRPLLTLNLGEDRQGEGQQCPNPSLGTPQEVKLRIGGEVRDVGWHPRPLSTLNPGEDR